MNEQDIEQQHNSHSTNSILSTLLKEVSDMKADLAVNSSETRNIKESINDIKNDVKEIKNDFINRREFNDAAAALRKEFNDSNTLIKEEFISALKNVKKDIEIPKKIAYGIAGAILLAVLTAILKLVLK